MRYTWKTAASAPSGSRLLDRLIHAQVLARVAAALALFTRGSALAAGEASERGVIAIGKAADFTVIDRMIDGDPQQLLDAKVQMTVAMGRSVTGRHKLACDKAVSLPLLRPMYMKNRIQFNELGRFKGICMKFHIDLLVSARNSLNLYEKPSRFPFSFASPPLYI